MTLQVSNGNKHNSHYHKILDKCQLFVCLHLLISTIKWFCEQHTHPFRETKNNLGTHSWILHLILDYWCKQSQIVHHFSEERFRIEQINPLSYHFLSINIFSSPSPIMFINDDIFDDNNFSHIYFCLPDNYILHRI